MEYKYSIIYTGRLFRNFDFHTMFRTRLYLKYSVNLLNIKPRYNVFVVHFTVTTISSAEDFCKLIRRYDITLIDTSKGVLILINRN